MIRGIGAPPVGGTVDGRVRCLVRQPSGPMPGGTSICWSRAGPGGAPPKLNGGFRADGREAEEKEQVGDIRSEDRSLQVTTDAGSRSIGASGLSVRRCPDD